MHEFRSAILAGDVKSLQDPVSRKERCRRQGGGSLATLVIPREERRTTNQRREDRFHGKFERASLNFRRKQSLVKVINVSRGGIMVETSIMPHIGESIAVEFEDGQRVEGTVRWVRGGRIGLDFGDNAVDLP